MYYVEQWDSDEEVVSRCIVGAKSEQCYTERQATWGISANVDTVIQAAEIVTMHGQSLGIGDSQTWAGKSAAVAGAVDSLAGPCCRTEDTRNL
jgi:hypothetical protein